MKRFPLFAVLTILSLFTLASPVSAAQWDPFDYANYTINQSNQTVELTAPVIINNGGFVPAPIFMMLVLIGFFFLVASLWVEKGNDLTSFICLIIWIMVAFQAMWVVWYGESNQILSETNTLLVTPVFYHCHSTAWTWFAIGMVGISIVNIWRIAMERLRQASTSKKVKVEQ